MRMLLKSDYFKFALKSTPILAIAKLLGLCLLYMLSIRFEADLYFQISILSGLMGTALMIGFVYQLQICSEERRNRILLSSLSCMSAIILALFFAGIAPQLLFAAYLQSFVLTMISYLYCLKDEQRALACQCLCVILLQPFIWLISATNIQPMEANWAISLPILMFVLILIATVVRGLEHKTEFVQRSIEVGLVSSFAYYIYSKGFSYSNYEEVFVFWLITQLGSIFVFVGANLSVYLIPKIKSQNKSIPDSLSIRFFAFQAGIVGSLAILVNGFSFIAPLAYSLVLIMAGITKIFTSSLLANKKTGIILIANTIGPSCCLLYEYIFSISSHEDMIFFICINTMCASIAYCYLLSTSGKNAQC